MSVELPFTLTHPKPEPVVESSKEDIFSQFEPMVKNLPDNVDAEKNEDDQAVPVDHNLIEFETR